MSVYDFRVPFSPPPDSAAEVIDPETIVEQSGYRSTEQMISEMMRAGENLMAARRRGDFDFDEEIVDQPLDVSPFLADDPVDRQIAFNERLSNIRSEVPHESAEVVENNSTGGKLPDNLATGNGGS